MKGLEGKGFLKDGADCDVCSWSIWTSSPRSGRLATIQSSTRSRPVNKSAQA
jgi:hypothetical protein